MKTFLLRKLLLTVSLTALAAIGAHAQVTNSTYTGANMGNWGEAGNWSPATVPNNSATMSYNVSLANHRVTLDINPTISTLLFGSGSASVTSVDHSLISGTTTVGPAGVLNFKAVTANVLMDAGALTNFTGTTLTGGTYTLTAAPGHTATLKFNGADIRTNSASISLFEAGTRIVNENDADAFRNLALNTVEGLLELQNGQSITTSGSLTNDGYLVLYGGTRLTVNGDFIDLGDFRDPGTVGFFDSLSTVGQNSLAVVTGTLPNYDPATKTLNKGRYFFGATDGAQNTLQVLGGPLLDIVNNNASIILSGNNCGLIDKNGANALRNLAVNQRYLQVGAINFTTVGNLTNTDDGAAFLVFGDSDFTVSGDLLNRATMGISPYNAFRFFTGVLPPLPVDPPAQASELKVNGKLTLEAASGLFFDVFGPSAPAVINVTGPAAFEGKLSVFVLDDLDAPVTYSDSLTVLTAASITGEFANAPSGRRVTAQKFSDFTPAGSFRANYSANQLVLSGYLPHAGLLNISSRLKVETGDEVTIAGFIIGGVDTKKIIIRGIGPSLTTRGVVGALSDPSIELFDAAGKSIMLNNDWQETQAAAIQASGLAPTDPHESALIATLDPGSYTAVLHGADNGSGLGLVEVYDLDRQPAGGELTNISTRGLVQTGDSVLIGGMIIQEGEAGHLIVRAIGPSLAEHNVSGALADPTLDLYDSSGVRIMSNDNWNDDPAQSAQLQDEGLAPTNVHESALLAVLAPGSYTAIVRGKADTTGVGLVEFYKLN